MTATAPDQREFALARLREYAGAPDLQYAAAVGMIEAIATRRADPAEQQLADICEVLAALREVTA